VKCLEVISVVLFKMLSIRDGEKEKHCYTLE